MSDTPIKTVCFTGHRDIEMPHALRLPSMLDARIRALYARGARDFRAGGALGFDMVAALKVLEIRETLPIRLVLCLPCRDQTRGWDEASCRAYRYVLDHADEVHYTADRYTPTCMLERDRALVDRRLGIRPLGREESTRVGEDGGNAGGLDGRAREARTACARSGR